MFCFLCIQIFAHDGGKEVCQRYQLNFNEYEKIFPKKYFYKLQLKKFILITEQKSGTNLIEKCLSLMTGKLIVDHSIVKSLTFSQLQDWVEKHNNFLFCHTSDIEHIKNADSSIKKITILRDFRDVIISRLFFMEKLNTSLPNLSLSSWKQLSYDEKITYLILEVSQNLFYTNPEILSDYLIIKFEDLVGEKGLGKNENQLTSIYQISNCLGIKLNSNQVKYIVNNLYGNTNSFRKGQIGDWKKYFNDDNKKLCKEIMNDWLIKFGYEKNDNW